MTDKKSKAKKKKQNYFYLDEKAKQFDFSDFVRITAYQHGLVLHFGKLQPDSDEFGIYQSILLPFSVADSLSTIIRHQLDRMVEQGFLTKFDEEGKK